MNLVPEHRSDDVLYILNVLIFVPENVKPNSLNPT